MNNEKQLIINDIMNHLINILVLDYQEAGSNTQDKKVVNYKFNNSRTINSIIKQCTPLCGRDWSADIIRDETYASVYEIMLDIADEYSEEELIQIYRDIDTKTLPITTRFLVSVYKLSIFKVKFNLSGHRRCSTGMIPAYDMVEYSEELFNPTIGIHVDNPDPDYCFFLKFFNENKEQFLTKKQLEFINDPNTVNNKNHGSYRKRIYENTLAAYQKQFKTDDQRLNELEDQIRLIEKILDAQDFVASLIKYRDKSFVLDAITSHVDMNTMREFNRGNRDKKVIKSYRVALFKKLDELNRLYDSVSK